MCGERSDLLRAWCAMSGADGAHGAQVFPQYRYNAPTIGQHDIDVRVERQQIRADEYDAQREELRLEDEAELRELEEEEARAQHEDAVAG